MSSKKPTVFAVCSVTIEIPIRPSGPEEKLSDLYRISIQEAEGALRNKLPPDFKVVGDVKFERAIVKEW